MAEYDNSKESAVEKTGHWDAELKDHGILSASPPPFQLTSDPAQQNQNLAVAEAGITEAGFGVKIDHTQKTLFIVANVYPSTATAKVQATRAANTWMTKSTVVDGYTIGFEITVLEPKEVTKEDVLNEFQTVNFFKKNGKLRKNLYYKYYMALTHIYARNEAENDPIGKSYAGNSGINSETVAGDSYTGGVTVNGKHAYMNTHMDKGDLGENNDMVTHEFGHFFGLDDQDGDKDGKDDPYYPGNGGIMEYAGYHLHPISDADVETILQYAKDLLAKGGQGKDSPIKILNSEGTSNGTNPLDIKSSN